VFAKPKTWCYRCLLVAGESAHRPPSVDETFGRYRLLKRLGHGGMAEVFKAKSFGVEGFEKVLVIKRILPELAKSKRFSDLFVHEAKLAVRLSHANIVQVFDLGTVEQSTGPTYFIAMEYVAGLDLATLLAHALANKAELPVGMCVYIAAEVAKGLDHAHRRRDDQLRPLGIVHRDVSPQNILLSWEGEVKVTDFGIAKARDLLDEGEPGDHDVERAQEASGEPSPNLLHGKYAYMSPEQARGQSVDARSDLFSLGVVLYEMLTGVNPFRGPTTFETLRRVKASEYPPVELLRPELSGALTALLQKALAEAPEQRFADAGRLYESLLAYLYSSGDRFGASDVARYMAMLRSRTSMRPPSINPDAVANEQPTAESLDESTPVEVPSAGSRASIPPETIDTGLPRGAAPAQRREVTALVFRLAATAHDASSEMREKVRELVERYGGTIVEDEPPQLAALFGLTEGDGRDIETAGRVALIALRRTGGASGGALTGIGRSASSISAGIHAGRILLSQSGEPLRNERLTALLTVAQEMAGLAPGACGISLSAAHNVRRAFQCSAPDRKRTISATPGLVLGELASPNDGLGRFVGRKAELKRVGEVLSLANRGRAFALTIRGLPGIGKTRLLLETDRRLKKGDFKVAFYLASCPPNGPRIALSGLSSMLQVLCGIREGDSELRILELEPRLRALGLNEEEVLAVLFQVGASAHGTAGPNALRTAFARMVASLAKDQLHVFGWDNAQALDSASIEILEYAAHRNADARAVFAFAVREGFPPPLSEIRHAQVIDLGALQEDDLRDLISARTGVLNAPPELVTFCRARAAGHPLFAEEVVRELLEGGSLVVAGGAVVSFQPSAELGASRPLRALMAARAARLPEGEREALYAAAILGDPIELTVLAQMLRETVSATAKVVEELERREFLRRGDASTVVFASPFLREVVVDVLPAEACRDLHLAAALAYLEVLGERSPDKAERIARHFFEAGERDRAASHFARSGERKLVGRAFAGSLRDTLRALELCDVNTRSASELAAWIAQLATAAYRVRSAPELFDRIAALLARIDEAGDLTLRVTARIDIASILVSTHALEAADAQISAAKQLANGNSRLLAQARFTEAELARRAGDWRKALARFEELASQPLDDDAKSHRVCMGLALCYAASGSEARAEEVVTIATRLASPDDVVLACERAKLEQLIAIFGRDYPRAIEKGQHAVALAREAGLDYEVAVNLHILGEALFRNHELPAAYASFKQSSALCEEIAAERVLVHNRSFLAYLDASADYPSAARALAESIAYAHAHHYAWDEVNARYLLARLLRDQAQPEARAEFEKCRELAQSVGFRLLADDCLAALTG
jgi:serine/threonine protein kinase/predicted ATPase